MIPGKSRPEEQPGHARTHADQMTVHTSVCKLEAHGLRTTIHIHQSAKRVCVVVVVAVHGWGGVVGGGVEGGEQV